MTAEISAESLVPDSPDTGHVGLNTVTVAAGLEIAAQACEPESATIVLDATASPSPECQAVEKVDYRQHIESWREVPVAVHVIERRRRVGCDGRGRQPARGIENRAGVQRIDKRQHVPDGGDESIVIDVEPVYRILPRCSRGRGSGVNQHLPQRVVVRGHLQVIHRQVVGAYFLVSTVQDNHVVRCDFPTGPEIRDTVAVAVDVLEPGDISPQPWPTCSPTADRRNSPRAS